MGPQLAAPERLAGAHVELGKLLVDAGPDLATVLTHYDAALRLLPTFELAHRLRAEVLLRLAEARPPAQAGTLRQEAALALDKYLQLSARPDIKAYRSRGLLHVQAGQLSRAVEVFSIGLQRMPQEKKCLVYRGWAYLLMNAGEAALEDFEECLRRDASDVEALCGRGRARALQRQATAALADAEAVRARLPGLPGAEQPRLRYNLACLYAQLLALLPQDAAAAAEQAPYALLYRKRISQHLQGVLESLPAHRRTAFWREQIQIDPALAAVRRDPAPADLIAEFLRAPP